MAQEPSDKLAMQHFDVCAIRYLCVLLVPWKVCIVQKSAVCGLAGAALTSSNDGGLRMWSVIV
jgi:hypothetical protein